MINNSLDYTWQGYRCTYNVSGVANSQAAPLVLIHPIGVGLSHKFWQRFSDEWLAQKSNLIYNPDLLGCGAGDMPAIAYYPIDWAKQLQYFIHNVVKQPVIYSGSRSIITDRDRASAAFTQRTD